LPLLHRRSSSALRLSPARAHGHERCLSASRLRSTPGRVSRVWLFTAPATAPLFGFLLLQAHSLDLVAALAATFRSCCSQARSSIARASLRSTGRSLTSQPFRIAHAVGTRDLSVCAMSCLRIASRRPRSRASSGAPVACTFRSSRPGSSLACTSRCRRRGVRRCCASRCFRIFGSSQGYGDAVVLRRSWSLASACKPTCSWIAPQGPSCFPRGCAGARGCFAASAFSGVARFAARAPLSTLAVASSCDARGRASRSVASGVALRGRGSLASFDVGSHDRLRAHRSRIRACCSRGHLAVIACAACASALSSHDRSLSADALRHRSIARDVVTRRAAPTFSCAFGRGHLAVLAVDCGRRRFDLSFCFRGGRDPDVFGCGHPLAKTSPAVPGAFGCLHLAVPAVDRSRGRGSAFSGSRSGACTLRCSRSSAC
jgi:hypothetical protein